MSPPRPDIESLAALDPDQVRHALDDPVARPVLDALAATRADLAGLADPPAPPAVAARWSAALQAELTRLAEPATDGEDPAHVVADPLPPAVSESPTTSPTTAGRAAARRSGRRGPGRNGPGGGVGSGARRRVWRRPAVVAAVALLLVLAASAVLRERPAPTGPPDLVGEGLRSIGIHDAGPYADDARRAACLAALAPPDTTPTAPLIGGRQVTLGGRAGVLLVLRTGRRGVLDVVVVDRDCTTLLAAGLVGG